MQYAKIIRICSASKENWRRTTTFHIHCQWTCCCPGVHTQNVSASNAELHQGCMPWLLIKTAMPSQEVNSTPPPPLSLTHTHTDTDGCANSHSWMYEPIEAEKNHQDTFRLSVLWAMTKLAQWVVCVCVCVGGWVMLIEIDYLVTPTWESYLLSHEPDNNWVWEMCAHTDTLCL